MSKIYAIKRGTNALEKNKGVSSRFAMPHNGDLVMDSMYGCAERDSFRTLENTEFAITLESDSISHLVRTIRDRKLMSNTNEFDIAILQKDKHYQGCGYEKTALLGVIDGLTKKGARMLDSGVSRKNTVAHELYKSVGLVPTEVFSGEIRLKKEVRDYD